MFVSDREFAITPERIPSKVRRIVVANLRNDNVKNTIIILNLLKL